MRTVSQMSQVSQPPQDEIKPEETVRAAVAEGAENRELGGQAAGLAWLDDWRARADDVTNPENWK